MILMVTLTINVNFRTVLSDNQAPFSLQMPPRKEGRGKFSSTRHSLPDLFEGLNYPPPNLTAPGDKNVSINKTFNTLASPQTSLHTRDFMF